MEKSRQGFGGSFDGGHYFMPIGEAGMSKVEITIYVQDKVKAQIEESFQRATKAILEMLTRRQYLKEEESSLS